MRTDIFFFLSIFSATSRVFCANFVGRNDEEDGLSDITALTDITDDSNSVINLEDEVPLDHPYLLSEPDLEVIRRTIHNRLSRNLSHLQDRGLISEESRSRVVDLAVQDILANIHDQNLRTDGLNNLDFDLEVGIEIELELPIEEQDDSSCWIC